MGAPASGAPGKTEWRALDIRDGDVAGAFAGADAVVHLAWMFQPTRGRLVTWDNNVLGSLRVFEAAAAAGWAHWCTPRRWALTLREGRKEGVAEPTPPLRGA